MKTIKEYSQFLTNLGKVIDETELGHHGDTAHVLQEIVEVLNQQEQHILDLLNQNNLSLTSLRAERDKYKEFYLKYFDRKNKNVIESIKGN